MSEQNQSQLPKPPTEAIAVDAEGYFVDKTGKRVTEDDDNKNIAQMKADQFDLTGWENGKKQ